MTERNQCDGCAVGAPINAWGNHQMPDGGRIGCTAHLYATPAPAQPEGETKRLKDILRATGYLTNSQAWECAEAILTAAPKEKP